MADDKPVIVIKKKGGHGGHHGGAWKIAYADFVTAMMCFFLCMWLINTASVTTRESIASYFRKPSLFTEGTGMPLLLGGAGILSDAYVPPKPVDKRPNQELTQDPAQKLYGESNEDRDKHYMREGRLDPKPHKGPDTITGLNSDKKSVEEIRREVRLRETAEKAKQALDKLIAANHGISTALGKVEVKIEKDKLKIEIMDTDRNSMFDSGSPRIKKDAEEAFQKVTDIVKGYSSNLDIVGHTDAKPFPTRTGGYTNWELSSDRANSARRLLESQGYPLSKVASVVGKAASELKFPETPIAAGNRRITLEVKFDGNDDPQSPSPTLKEAREDLQQLLGPPPGQSSLPAGAPEAIPTPTPTATFTPTPSPTPTPVPTRIGVRPSRPGRIIIPEGTPITSNPDYMPEDKIFGNNPVLGARELYSGN